MRLFSWFLILVASLLPAVPARAALAYHPVTLDDGTRVLVIAGVFDFEEPTQPLLNAIRARRPDLVMFDSPGGSPVAAMEIGRLIRKQGLATVQSRSFQCDSACALAFFGGIRRHAEPGAIGVHQSSFTSDAALNRDDAVSAIQSLTADIISYLVEMGIDPAVMKLALSYESSDMRYLSASEMIEFGILDYGAGSNQPDVAMAPSAPAAPKPVPTAPSAMNSAQATEFVQTLIQMHTLPSFQALPALRFRYSSIVDYYGNPTSLNDVMADKENYFKRWPLRSYEILQHSLHAECSRGQTCVVTGLYSWAVISVERNKKAAGTASFEYVLTANAPYRVLKETSEVVERR